VLLELALRRCVVRLHFTGDSWTCLSCGHTASPDCLTAYIEWSRLRGRAVAQHTPQLHEQGAAGFLPHTGRVLEPAARSRCVSARCCWAVTHHSRSEGRAPVLAGAGRRLGLASTSCRSLCVAARSCAVGDSATETTGAPWPIALRREERDVSGAVPLMQLFTMIASALRCGASMNCERAADSAVSSRRRATARSTRMTHACSLCRPHPRVVPRLVSMCCCLRQQRCCKRRTASSPAARPADEHKVRIRVPAAASARAYTQSAEGQVRCASGQRHVGLHHVLEDGRADDGLRLARR
jgi:hypothetical protein